MDINLKLEILNDQYFVDSLESVDVSIKSDTVQFGEAAFNKVEFIKMLKIIEFSGEIECQI